MRLARNLRLSVKALSAHPVRTGLAVAGTAIGVASVLVLTAIGEGARAKVISQIERLGRNMLVVSAAKRESRAGRKLTGDGWTRELRVEDAAAIVRGSPAVIRAAPAQDRGMRAKFGPIANPTTVLGTTPEWLAIRQFPLAEGRFFSDEENDRRALVAVLGSEARQSLFPDSVSPLGRTIRIGKIPFEVVGVLASNGVSVDGNATEDDRIVVPIQTALRRVFNTEYLKLIYLEASSPAALAQAERDAAAVLRVRHELPPGVRDDFVIQNQRALLAAQLAAQRSFQRLILGLGLLSLLVGGVGILSMMLLSIGERRLEIGLRVAVGARRRDVAVQFLAESLLLAVAGGVIGVLLGVGVARLVSAGTAWEARVSAGALMVALSSALAIGVGFGVVPAWRAAGVDPIVGLRTE